MLVALVLLLIGGVMMHSDSTTIDAMEAEYSPLSHSLDSRYTHDTNTIALSFPLSLAMNIYCKMVLLPCAVTNGLLRLPLPHPI